MKLAYNQFNPFTVYPICVIFWIVAIFLLITVTIFKPVIFFILWIDKPFSSFKNFKKYQTWKEAIVECSRDPVYLILWSVIIISIIVNIISILEGK